MLRSDWVCTISGSFRISALHSGWNPCECCKCPSFHHPSYYRKHWLKPFPDKSLRVSTFRILPRWQQFSIQAFKAPAFINKDCYRLLPKSQNSLYCGQNNQLPPFCRWRLGAVLRNLYKVKQKSHAVSGKKKPELPTATVADSPLHNCCLTATAEEYKHDYFCMPTQSWTMVQFSLVKRGILLKLP